jgi:hypothetical protein
MHRVGLGEIPEAQHVGWSKLYLEELVIEIS